MCGIYFVFPQVSALKILKNHLTDSPGGRGLVKPSGRPKAEIITTPSKAGSGAEPDEPRRGGRMMVCTAIIFNANQNLSKLHTGRRSARRFPHPANPEAPSAVRLLVLVERCAASALMPSKFEARGREGRERSPVWHQSFDFAQDEG